MSERNKGFTFSEEYLFTELRIAGLIENLENGSLRCASCNKTLDASNIGYVTSEDGFGKGIATCKNPSCISKAQNWMDISFEKPNERRT